LFFPRFEPFRVFVVVPLPAEAREIADRLEDAKYVRVGTVKASE
jgi:hypothetical protein